MKIKDIFQKKSSITQKRIVSVAIFLLWFILIYFLVYKRRDEEFLFIVITTGVLNSVLFYFSMSSKDISSIYFEKENYNDIVSELELMGFDKYKESSSKIKFRDNNKWWKRHRIFIYKRDNGIWHLDAKNRFIKNFEKYMVRYKKLIR